MERLTPIINFLSKTLRPVKVLSLYITPTYWEVIVILILLFFLVFTLARMRYLYVNWHLGPHSFAMLFWGFLLALIIEGFFILGGRTLFTEILGINNVPKPISTVLDIGRNRLINVLGVTTGVPVSDAQEEPNSNQVYGLYSSLSPDEAKKVYDQICKP